MASAKDRLLSATQNQLDINSNQSILSFSSFGQLLQELTVVFQLLKVKVVDLASKVLVFTFPVEDVFQLIL